MTLSDTISSLSQLSEHLIQLVDAQSIPIPPLLNGASVERFRNDDHVQTTVHQFQKHIKHIHSAQAILGRAVKTLEWHVNSVHNAKAAVSRLPVEVIDLIFKAGHQEPSHRSDLLYPLMISRVCRSWRAVALGSSWLWEWVSPHWPLPQILAWFNRVHQHPVSVWLELGIDDIWYSRDIGPFLEFPRIVQEHSNYRVLSISGYAGVRDGTSVIRNTFMEIQRIMKAETLILNSFGTLDSVIGDLEFVRHLFVQRCTIKPVQLMTMKFLISLSIHGGLLDDWWGILAHVSSTLETLILVDHLIGDENRDNRITLDNLQHLIIGQRDEELTFLSGIWKWIRTPGLRHLVVFSDWAIRLNTLGDDSDFVTNFLGLIRDTRNLEQVKVGGCPNLTAIILKALGDVHGHVKHLRRISLAVSQRSVIQALEKFLRSRREDPQLSAIAELDVILPSSFGFLGEAHLRKTFQSEVEYITVKRSTDGLLTFLEP